MSLIKYILVFFLSIITTIIFTSAILYSDRKSKEPIYMIIICLMSGVFTICLALLLGQIILPNLEVISSGLFSYNTNNSIKILVLALVEEYSKLVILYLFISKNKNFDDIYDGFVYSALIALSFGVMESLIYVFSESSFFSMTSLAIIRSITTLPLHLICGIIMGYYVGIEKFSFGTKTRIFNLFKALLFPTIIHFLYNFIISKIILNIKSDIMFVLYIIIFFIPIIIICILYIKNSKKLNYKYINNIKYKNLMTKEEYNEIIKSIF